MNLVTQTMAKRGKGRPKGAGKINFRYGIVASDAYREWMKEFMDSIGHIEVSDVFREGVKELAKIRGFRPPPIR